MPNPHILIIQVLFLKVELLDLVNVRLNLPSYWPAEIVKTKLVYQRLK